MSGEMAGEAAGASVAAGAKLGNFENPDWLEADDDSALNAVLPPKLSTGEPAFLAPVCPRTEEKGGFVVFAPGPKFIFEAGKGGGGMLKDDGD